MGEKTTRDVITEIVDNTHELCLKLQRGEVTKYEWEEGFCRWYVLYTDAEGEEKKELEQDEYRKYFERLECAGLFSVGIQVSCSTIFLPNNTDLDIVYEREDGKDWITIHIGHDGILWDVIVRGYKRTCVEYVYFDKDKVINRICKVLSKVFPKTMEVWR